MKMKSTNNWNIHGIEIHRTQLLFSVSFLHLQCKVPSHVLDHYGNVRAFGMTYGEADFSRNIKVFHLAVIV
jgi:hypothetical protein